MTTSTQNSFSKRLDDDAQGNTRLSLGTKYPVVYVAKGKDIFKETPNGLVKVTIEEQVAKPWIRENFERERAFQRKKNLAIALQRTHIPLRERREYKRRAGWVGAR